MELEEKKKFIINFIYFVLVLAAAYVILSYALPFISPFVIAFIIAFLLKGPVRMLSRFIPLNRRLIGLMVIILFYVLIGFGIFILGAKVISAIESLFVNLPGIYSDQIEPFLMGFFNSLEQTFRHLDPNVITALENIFYSGVQTLGNFVSDLSVTAMRLVSGFASGVPGAFVKLLLTIIASLFMTMDYDRITSFILYQLPPHGQDLVMQVKNYVVGTLFVCIRSYALIMFITFLELSVGLFVIGIKNAVMIAFLIALFDILPILGTGGIMIPWALITLIQKNYPLGFGLLLVYLIVTVIRNILEPKIVGNQIGLHPVVTLISLFVGAQLFGIVGLFGLPIFLSLLRYLNDNGTIHLFNYPEWMQKPSKKEENKLVNYFINRIKKQHKKD